ncbi:protein FAR1-RELATED SEQUENCE 7-like protein [Corchorus olitorius]|uniref:Protein FAR1-RELATED SEQUENCE 7-like protein n=1 Tax=Corchorus olitorius TaxID=93759 RepID=A0A1R3HAS3_9ROSI|nr:protein FAR1-RELATED SEQUENCE 7-like protein [Corchorus olitorius]
MMMRSSMGKFATAIMVLLVFLGDHIHPLISAANSIPSAGEDKSVECGYWRKKFPGKLDGISLECVVSSKRKLKFRRLRSTSTLSSPPSPTKSKATSMAAPSPPPPYIRL